MRLQKKNVFKAVILTGCRVKTFFSAFCGVFLLAVLIYIFAQFSTSNFFDEIMDIFFMRSRVHAQITEFFTDSKGRVHTIIDGYTMLVSEKTPSASPDAMNSTPEPLSPSEPKTEERTITAVEEIKNQTDKNPDIRKLINEPLYFENEGKKPTVLIIHTHTTESYFETDRNLDENKNMIAIGKVINKKLTDAGISVIHDTTVHDYPSYNNAYTRSAATVKNNIKNCPDINIVLDIHRDAVATEDGSKLSLVTDINGKKAAQMMFVVGTDAQLTHDKWQENLKLALKFQHKANELYPSLMRPINLREQRFNQQLSRGSIIIEVGSNGNTLDEAKQGAELMGDVIANVLLHNE